MITREWWIKNAGGLFLSGFVAVCMYAASAYITTAVTREMKGYVPLQMWIQWASEREAWRGQADQRIKALESESIKQREENMRQLKDLSKDVAVQTTILMEVKSAVDNHVNGVRNPKP